MFEHSTEFQKLGSIEVSCKIDRTFKIGLSMIVAAERQLRPMQTACYCAILSKASFCITNKVTRLKVRYFGIYRCIAYKVKLDMNKTFGIQHFFETFFKEKS